MNTSPNAGQGPEPNTDASITRCVAYIRTDVPHVVENDLSVAEQEARIEAYASTKGWTVRSFYEDDGFSGFWTERPSLKRLMADAKAHRFDHVIVCQLCTLSQDVYDFETILTELLDASVDMTSIKESLDTSTPIGKLFFEMATECIRFEKVLHPGLAPRPQPSFQCVAAEEGFLP